MAVPGGGFLEKFGRKGSSYSVTNLDKFLNFKERIVVNGTEMTETSLERIEALSQLTF